MSVYKGPERLLNDSYMTLSAPFRLFKHSIDGLIDTHWHEFFEMGFVVSGSGTHVLNGVPSRLTRGSAFLLTPADFHSLKSDPGETLQLYDFIFKEQFIREPLFELLFGQNTEHAYWYLGDEIETIEREYERIWDETLHWQAGSDLLIQGSVERLLIDLSRKCKGTGQAAQASTPDLMQPVQSSVRKALIYIQHHFREAIPLEEVASYCGLSANYFSECFRKGTGTTFQSYVQELRLQFAKSLLKTTQLPVTEICFASGFNTLPHFERAFKKRFGLPPRLFRKQ
ncbi:helix-turn-helix domain-containing protein [Paenibacillus montanisoli]|uniref:AraC family transcriptional regulator n=1 Tax=Paenibacillus montanisoli TaxID=2081970 RepID=A0A328U5B6_9BACL|nr:AraC family transcriptional regulator [Paenibacillus montanisoli]RAP77800.1 AraC family transcriptional regulator [Paenibacillus montanisoli]